MSKRKRIWTNRDFSVKDSYECIEIDERGIFFWCGADNSDTVWKVFKGAPEIPSEAAFSFPVDLEFVKGCFALTGRVLDETKLPEGFVRDPYQRNCA